MAVFSETIKLEDAVSAPAAKAGEAMSKLTSGLQATNATLGKTGEVSKAIGEPMKAAGKSTFDAANAMKIGKDTILSSISSIKGAFTSLAAGDVKGAIAGVTDAVAGIAKMLDLVVPGLGEAVAAVVQIAGGLVGITVGLIKSGVEFAISSSEAKQQMLGLFDAMGGGLVTGAQTEDMIDGIKAKFGIAKDSLIEYTKALMAMGRNDLSQMEGDLLAVASAAALVKGGDQALLGFVKKIDLATEAGIGLKIPTKQLASLAATGANVGDVAKVMGVSVESLTKNLAAGTVDAAKFGSALQEAVINKGKGPLEKMAASSANLKKLFSESMGDLFEDIDVGPFMQQVKELLDIFGQSSASGQTMKAAIGGYFKEVFGLLTKVVPIAKHFLLDMIIYGLKAYIAIKPIAKAIADFAKSAAGGKIITVVLSAIWTILKVVGAVLVVVVAAMLVLWAAMVVVSTVAWTLVAAFIDGLYSSFMLAWDGLTSLGEAIQGFLQPALDALAAWANGAADAAINFITGLVDGIKNGAAQVIAAVKGLATQATGAFKSALGIKSPSKVMAGLGGHMGGGVVQGLEESESDVHGAASGVADAAVKGMSSPGASSGAGGGGRSGPANITVMVQIDGAGKSALEITEEMVSQTFQRMALEAGV